MIKKVGFFILLFIIVFLTGLSFADLINPDIHKVDTCVKLGNTSIDGYMAIIVIEPPFEWEKYIPNEFTCLKQHYHAGRSLVYLIPKHLYNTINKGNYREKGILVGEINPNNRGFKRGENENINGLTITYKITKDNGEYKLQLLDEHDSKGGIRLDSPFLKFFLVLLCYLFFAMLTNFLTIFIFKEQKWKDSNILNRRIIIVGIINSIIPISLIISVLVFINEDIISEEIYGYIITGFIILSLSLLTFKYGLNISRKKTIIPILICSIIPISILYGAIMNLNFFYAWLFTILIETLMLLLISKYCWITRNFKNLNIFSTGILASSITLPLLRFVLPIFFSNYRVYVIFGEILVAIIEAVIMKYSLKIERKMAIFASIVCNLCSFLAGLFIF